MSPGARVQYSPHALRHARDYWLGQHGTRKDAARAEYDRQSAMRGTVTETKANEWGGIAWCRVAWDDGTTSQTQPGRLTAAGGPA